MVLQLAKRQLIREKDVIRNNVRSIENRYVTAREKEVLQKLSEGLTVKEIAAYLYVSTHTIISHKKNLVSKFDARNSVDLVVKAIRQNIVII